MINLKLAEEVYEPREDSYLLSKEVKKLARRKIVLDVGTGSGIQAITAALSGAKKVYASDISLLAAMLASKNSKRNKADIFCFTCDLLSAIKQNVKFDLIIFNAPYLPGIEPLCEHWSGGYQGIEVVLKLLQQAIGHIKDNGKVLFILSNYADRDNFRRVIHKIGFDFKVLSQEHYFFEDIYACLAVFTLNK